MDTKGTKKKLGEGLTGGKKCAILSIIVNRRQGDTAMLELSDALAIPQTLSRIAAETGLAVAELRPMIDAMKARGEILLHCERGGLAWSRIAQ